QKNLTLAADAADAPAVLVTDEVLLTRVLRNLLGNAVKFTVEGEVRLTVRSAPDHVAFVVTDTGPGIPPAYSERVFEEFYQVPGTSAPGTGLGLPYARRLTAVLGGELTLDSTLGEGTTVTVRLPTHRPLAGLGPRAVLGIDGAAAADDAVASGAPDLVLLGPGTPDSDVPSGLPPGTMVVAVTAEPPGRPPPGRADATVSRDHLDPLMLAETVWDIRERKGRR